MEEKKYYLDLLNETFLCSNIRRQEIYKLLSGTGSTFYSRYDVLIGFLEQKEFSRDGVLAKKLFSQMNYCFTNGLSCKLDLNYSMNESRVIVSIVEVLQNLKICTLGSDGILNIHSINFIDAIYKYYSNDEQN
ncbi:hypothetical protein [Flavobacterium sp. NKUCC04_CG]|uniref:hypothetical protein n=1 Tax=Flavobacterium sp. NKUCC04_CG TaxID=2842121 RepID=UPI001C5BFAB5|nr:hypothetical protein [Flavobacterium sp. NKUCC04_CG]MBW3519504.1 hypothetical protein [Flavobacterium sp. NKUCC04_CG]